MKSLLKNINIYWLGATILAIWFLFIHSPPILIERQVFHDLPFLTHLIGAYSLYLACIFNTLFTPSTLNGKSRYLHVYMGRLSLIAGMIGFMYGLFCSWWPWRETPDIGFAIGVSFGGLFQVVFQIRGYLAIRKYKELQAQLERSGENNDRETLIAEKNRALEIHIRSMLGVFLAACGIPAIMRLLGLFSWGGALLPVMIGLVIYCISPYSNIFMERIEPLTGGSVPLLIERKSTQYT